MESQKASSGKQQIRLLIVDDIAETRQQIKGLLKYESDIVVVGEGRTGKDAILDYDRLKPDVMTTCINMPDMDGITATEFICQKYPDAEIIVLSNQSESDYIRRAKLAGAKEYLAKPLSKEELVDTIRKAGKRAISRPITIPPNGERTSEFVARLARQRSEEEARQARWKADQNARDRDFWLSGRGCWAIFCTICAIGFIIFAVLTI